MDLNAITNSFSSDLSWSPDTLPFSVHETAELECPPMTIDLIQCQPIDSSNPNSEQAKDLKWWLPAILVGDTKQVRKDVLKYLSATCHNSGFTIASQKSHSAKHFTRLTIGCSKGTVKRSRSGNIRRKPSQRPDCKEQRCTFYLNVYYHISSQRWYFANKNLGCLEHCHHNKISPTSLRVRSDKNDDDYSGFGGDREHYDFDDGSEMGTDHADRKCEQHDISSRRKRRKNMTPFQDALPLFEQVAGLVQDQEDYEILCDAMQKGISLLQKRTRGQDKQEAFQSHK